VRPHGQQLGAEQASENEKKENTSEVGAASKLREQAEENWRKRGSQRQWLVLIGCHQCAFTADPGLPADAPLLAQRRGARAAQKEEQQIATTRNKLRTNSPDFRFPACTRDEERDTKAVRCLNGLSPAKHWPDLGPTCPLGCSKWLVNGRDPLPFGQLASCWTGNSLPFAPLASGRVNHKCAPLWPEASKPAHLQRASRVAGPPIGASEQIGVPRDWLWFIFLLLLSVE